MSNDKQLIPPKVVREFLRRSDVNAKAAGLEETTLYASQEICNSQVLWKICCNYESEILIFVYEPTFGRWYYQKMFGEFSWPDDADDNYLYVGGVLSQRMQGGTAEAYANADCMYTG